MIRIIIARHGNTFLAGEPPRRLGSGENLPLTVDGERQAARLGRYLALLGLDISAIHAAPLLRTRQTAAAISSELSPSPPINVTPWLSEIDHGPDEGQTDADVVARVGAAALRVWDSDAVPPPGWHVDANGLTACWRTEAIRTDKGNRLFVTSNGIARFALLALIEPPLPMSLKLRTGAFGLITIENERASLERWDERPPE